jgi:hypothetical protein
MARGKLDEANRLFELILQDEPNHLMALTGRVSHYRITNVLALY